MPIGSEGKTIQKFLARHWPSVLAIALQAQSIAKAVLYLLDLRGKYDAFTESLRDIGGVDGMISYLLDPPPWMILLVLVVGLFLIWWDVTRRNGTKRSAMLNTWGPLVLIVGGPIIGVLWLLATGSLSAAPEKAEETNNKFRTALAELISTSAKDAEESLMGIFSSISNVDMQSSGDAGFFVIEAARRVFNISLTRLKRWLPVRILSILILRLSTITQTFASEAASTAFIKSRVAKGTELMADEATSWNPLHAAFPMKRINHEQAYSFDGACTNGAEEFFSRLRRMEIGHHHKIAGVYINRYASEAGWRDDHRRVSNGEQVRSIVGLVIKNKPSVDFCGYWQRHVAA
jgi:hypothetical protein